MLGLAPGVYAGWRAQRLNQPFLAEKPALEEPPESLLHQIWNHQRLKRTSLHTLDGRRVRVLHPGFLNREAGPDFRKALLQIGDDPPQIGDVEIDLAPGLWKSHGHQKNPAYQEVRLHVIWAPNFPTPPGLPVLALKNYLDSSLAELQDWAGSAMAAEFPVFGRGQCSGPLQNLPMELTGEVLRQAAQVRLQRKAATLEARARETGWIHALWEGLFGALGYKNNFWPMTRVAELLPVLQDASPAKDSLAWEARLLGVASLLPIQVKTASSSEYHRKLWDIWWRERGPFQELILPKSFWCLRGIRPANHPQRRLALAAQWLAGGELPSQVERWLKRDLKTPDLGPSLLALMQPTTSGFWNWHWNLNAKKIDRPQPLLGLQRASDLAVNIILPWLWARAARGPDPELKKRVETRYFQWPASEDNAVLKLARQRLMPGSKPSAFKTAASQQGLLQIVRDFCDYSNSACENCPFPELIKSLNS